jgi:spore coat-associated protein N
LEEKKMGIKKKLGLGMATAALGFSLVGGGTFAYFNDVDTINNKLASGVLDMKIGAKDSQPISFDLSNMKPGDSITRKFTLDAVGTLAIQDVFMALTANPSDFIDGHNVQTGNADALKDYLSQFRVTMFKGQINPQSGNSSWDPTGDIVSSGAVLTLRDLYENNLNGKISTTFYKDGKINLTPTGLPVDPQDIDGVQMQITFNNENGDQNRFQGDAAKFQFVLTGTQYAGTSVDEGASNGYLEGNEHIQGGTGAGAAVINKSNSSTNITNDGTNPFPVLNSAVTPGTDVPNDK